MRKLNSASGKAGIAVAVHHRRLGGRVGRPTDKDGPSGFQ